MKAPDTEDVARWARDPLEAVARRVSGEDPEDGPAYGYHATLADLLAWWRAVVEPAGDWDTYADPMVSRIEHDYLRTIGRGAGEGAQGVLLAGARRTLELLAAGDIEQAESVLADYVGGAEQMDGLR